MTRTQFLHGLSTAAFGAGILLALPGAFLILAASWFMDRAVTQEQADHDHALDLEVR